MCNFAVLRQLRIAKQKNVALFSARIQVAFDDSKLFIRVLKSSPKRWGTGTPHTP